VSILEGHDHESRISGTLGESELEIEGSRVLRDGMNDDSANTDDVSGVRDTLDGIFEETPANAFSGEAEIDSEPPQHDDRNRIRHVSSELPWQPSQTDRPRIESVIA
jgi:hypothetical protein